MASTIKDCMENIINYHAEPEKCPICGKEFVPTKIKFLNKERVIYCRDCNCLEEKEQREKEEERRRKREERLRLKYQRANIGKRYIDMTLDKLEAMKTENIAAAKKYVEEFNPVSGASLHLLGEFGNGKTSVGYAILRELLENGYNGIYVTWLDIVNRFYYAKSFNSEEKIDGVLVDLSNFDIIVIDEFVINLKDEREINLATELFDRLYRDNKCFILINNPCDIADMKAVPRLGKLLDRVREQADKLIFKHSSYRKGV